MKRFAPGDVIGDLRIESEIGRGAFGRVYLATDALLERRIALKVVPAQPREIDTPETRRILVEARAAGQIHSPYVVPLYRVHPPSDHDAWMFEMEYIEGGSLSELLEDDQPLDTAHALAIAQDVARALEAAHRSGVVHGDIKPGNILLDAEGRARLGDFGLAHVVGDASISVSGVGFLAGTPAYMAPERVMGDTPAPTGDLWGLGVLLFRMLAGRVPFVTHDIFALFHEIQNAPPAPMPAHVPDALAEIVRALLDKVPSRRPPLDALLEVTPDSPVTVAVPTTPAPGEPSLRGRDVELNRIENSLDRAVVDHRGVGTLVSGEPGVGKTALVRRAGRLARERGMYALEVRVSPLEGLFVPLVRTLRATLDTEGRALFESEPFGSAAHVVRDLLEGDDGQGWDSIESARWAVERSLLGLIQSRGALLVIEDAHESTEHDVQLLRHLLRHLPPQGLVMLMTARSPGSDAGESVSRGNLALAPVAADPEVEHLALRPLEREETFALLEELRPGKRWAAEVTQRLLELGGGNPLYTIEGLRQFEATGATREEAGRILPGPRWNDERLPDALRGLVATRIGALGDDEHELLDVAAADGLEFDAAAVAAVLDSPVLNVLRGLQRIYRERGVILPTREGFRFANALSHDALYEQLAPALRSELHRMLAEHLESGQREASPARLAQHWERAGERERARPYARRAALDCLNRHELQRGLDWAERGGMGPDCPDDLLLAESELALKLVIFLREAGLRDRGAALLDRLQRAAKDHGPEQLALACAMARIRERIQDEGTAAVEPEAVEQVASALESGLDRARAFSSLADVLRARSRLDEALVAIHEADRMYRKAGSKAGRAGCLAKRGGIHLVHAEYDSAERCYADAAREAHEGGERLNAAIHRINRAIALKRMGKVEEAIPLFEHSIRTLDLEGAEIKAANARCLFCSTLMAAGRIRQAKEAVDEAIETFERNRDVENALRARNDALIPNLLLGELDAVSADIDTVEKTAIRRGAPHPVSACLLSRMDLHLLGGNHGGAYDAARAAIAHGVECGQPAILLEVIEYLAMQVTLGLPARVLPDLRRATPDESRPLTETLLSAAEAWVDPTPGREDSLIEAAQALRQTEAVRGDQEMLLTADLLEVEGWARRGRRPEAAALARRAAAAAREQERVWHQLAFLQRIGDKPAHDEAARLVERLSVARRDAADRQRLVDAWVI